MLIVILKITTKWINQWLTMVVSDDRSTFEPTRIHDGSWWLIVIQNAYSIHNLFYSDSISLLIPAHNGW